jgi:hypothetical protein
MDDAAYERMSQGLRDWLGTVLASERSTHDPDRLEIRLSRPGTRQALVTERAELLTRYIRGRTTERQLRCEVHRIVARHQAEATSDMRRRIDAFSERVRAAQLSS